MKNNPSTNPSISNNGGACSTDDYTLRESSDNYSSVIINFFANYRLIKCKYNMQWIVQKRSAHRPNAGVWVGVGHVTSKSMLLVLCSQLKLIRDIHTAEKVLQLPSKVVTVAKWLISHDHQRRTDVGMGTQMSILHIRIITLRSTCNTQEFCTSIFFNGLND